MTARKQAEDNLRTSEERFRMLYERSPLGYQSLDAEGCFLEVNQAWLDTLGYERHEVIGRWFGDFLPPPYIEAFRQRFPRFKEAGEVHNEFEMKRKDGTIITVAFDGKIGYNIDGSFKQTHCILHDITNRKQAAQALEDSNRRQTAMLDSIPDPAWMKDREGRHLAVNQAWCRWLGKESRDVLGRTDAEIYPAGLAERFRQEDEQVMRSASPSRIEECVPDASGALRWYETIKSPILNEQGLGVGTTGIARDMTERKQAEEALRNSEERFRNIVESSPAAMYFYHLEADGRLILTGANPSADRHIGIAHTSLLGKTIEEAFPSLVATDVPSLYRKVARGELGPQSFEISYQDERFSGEYDVHVFRTDSDTIAVAFTEISARKQAEEDVREARELYESIFQANPATIVLTTLKEGRYLAVNQAHEALSGYRRDEVIGHLAEEFQAWVDPTERDRVIQRALREGMVRNLEVQFRRRSGEQFTGLLSMVPAKVAGESCLISIVTDISERKRAEEALRASEAFNRSLIEHLPQSIFIKDRQSRYISCNANYARGLGITPEKVVGKDDFAFHARELAERYRADDRAVMASGNRLDVEEPYILAGQERIAHTIKVPYRDEKGQIIGVLGMFEDITERKQVEEALRESQANLAAAQRVAQIGSWEWDIRNDWASWSDETYRIFGLTPAVLVDHRQAFLNSIHPADRVRVDQALTDAVTGARDYDLTYRITLPDGIEKLIHAQAEMVRDHNGQPVMMHGTVQDITARQQAEEERERLQAQLAQAQKLESIGRLAGGVAHDFNNMLSVILGHAELALGHLEPWQPIHADLQQIQKAAQRSAELTRQLLAFGRKQVISPKVLELNEAVDGMLKMLGRLIGEDIELIWQPSADLPPVRMDPSQLDQILANLCVNARDAVTAGGKVFIETQQTTLTPEDCAGHPEFMPGDYVLLTVSDNGCGMDRQTIERLFEPFFTTKEMGKGTGLGLAIVYGIVRQNNGFIHVYSEVGQGSTFKIFLPSYTGQAKQPSAGTLTKPAQHGNETILLVEDEPAILQMTCAVLTVRGYTVLAAAKPSEAIRLAETHDGPIDLLLTDVVMPEMNGPELAEKLLSGRPRLKRLFMSGYTADAIAPGVMERGAAFIEKPFTLDDLAEQIRATLEHKAVTEQG